jgi:perosamine synthetase
MRRLPYSRQSIGEDDIRAVAKVLRSAFLTQGPEVKRFEDALAKYTGARYCVAFSSGTAALHAAYFAVGIRKEDEVIVPALTFAATANAVLYLDAKPVFADIDSATGNIDVEDVQKKITRRTKAVVAVDYAGLPADIEAVRRLAKKYGLVFIEDSAQGLGATYKGKEVGALADMTMFSFHPVKSITTGEGGAILTNSKEYYEKLVMFRSHGLTRDPKKLKNKNAAVWHQEMQLLGYNYRLTDMQAALGTSQMKKLDRFVRERRAAAKRYFELFADISDITLPLREGLKNSAWHLFVIHVDPRIRDKVFTALRAVDVGVQVHYLPVYLHPYYRSLGYRQGLCPKTEAFSASAISIPLFPGITKKEQQAVVRKLCEILRRYEK